VCADDRDRAGAISLVLDALGLTELEVATGADPSSSLPARRTRWRRRPLHHEEWAASVRIRISPKAKKNGRPQSSADEGPLVIGISHLEISRDTINAVRLARERGPDRAITTRT